MDEYFHVSGSSAIKYMKQFCASIKSIYGETYLRAPDPNELARLLEENEERGMPGMVAR